jgi:pimeloyl-ACP methyl ester carboxylesterase
MHSIQGSPLSLEREYDVQLSHTIWELERAVKRGGGHESLRRSLVEAHAQHLRHLEEIAQLPRPQRSILILQARPTESVLLLPDELSTCEDLEPLAEWLAGRGFAVLASNLAYRTLDRRGHSPTYWQTVADEAENRYDILAHYSTRIAVVGVGMGALLALHLAVARRTSAVAALFPTFGSEPGWFERFRLSLRRLVRRDSSPPSGWKYQRRQAAHAAHEAADKVPVPLFLLIENRQDRSDAARSARVAQKMVHRAATVVRTLGPGESAGVRELSPASLEELHAFLRQR